MKSRKKLPGESRPLVSEAAERIATIVDAAEQAAAKVIDEAEEQARREVETARARADRIAAEHLRDLADRLDPPAPDDRPVPHLKPVEPPPAEDDGAPAPSSRSGLSAARLLATQMAVSGSSREEIGERLRTGFEIEDPTGILDAILGPEG